jgi:tryptophanyl-tRNA synthetase
MNTVNFGCKGVNAMHFGFSYVGLIYLVMLMLPNLLWTKNQPKDYENCNVYKLYELFATPEQCAELAQNYRTPGFGYGHAKLALYNLLLEKTEEPRRIYNDFMERPDTLEDILRDGAQRASIKMNEVLNRARNAVGYKV